MKKIYSIKGEFKQGIFKHKFMRELVATSENHALERVLSELGSRHKLTRNQIHIAGVAEIKPEEVKDQKILALLE